MNRSDNGDPRADCSPLFRWGLTPPALRPELGDFEEGCGWPAPGCGHGRGEDDAAACAAMWEEGSDDDCGLSCGGGDERRGLVGGMAATVIGEREVAWRRRADVSDCSAAMTLIGTGLRERNSLGSEGTIESRGARREVSNLAPAGDRKAIALLCWISLDLTVIPLISDMDAVRLGALMSKQ